MLKLPLLALLFLPIPGSMQEGAIARIGTTRFRHGSPIRKILFFPDGKRLASAGGQNRHGPASEIVIWEAVTGRRLRTLEGGEWSVLDMEICRDGSRLAATADATLRVWDVSTWKPMAIVERGEGVGWYYGVALSPDGSKVASARTGPIFVLDARTGEIIRRIPHPENSPVYSLSFSPDGKVLAAGGVDTCVGLWDWQKGEKLRRLVGHMGIVSCVAFSPDGTRLASGSDDASILLWDPGSEEYLLELEGSKGRVQDLAFSPDGKRLASAGQDEFIRLWDIASGKVVRRLPTGEPWTNTVAFSPSGDRIAWGGSAATVFVQDLASREGPRVDGLLGGIHCLAFAPDGETLAAGDRSRDITIWAVPSGKIVRRLRGHSAPVVSLAYSRDGRMLCSGSGDGTVRIWDPGSGKTMRRLDGHRGGIDSMALSPDGATVATAATGIDERSMTAEHESVRLWNLDSGELLREIGEPGDEIRLVAFHPGGDLLMTGSDQMSGTTQVHLWATATGELVSHIPVGQDSVYGAAFSPTGDLLICTSGRFDSSIRIIEIATGRRHFLGKADSPISPILFRDGRSLLAATRGGDLCCLDLDTWSLRATHRPWGGPAGTAALSPNEDVLATGGGDTRILLWDAGTVLGPPPDPPAAPDATALDRAWEDLAEKDLPKALHARSVILATGEGVVPFLRARLHPLLHGGPDEIRGLIGDLGSNDPACRKAAVLRLGQCGERAQEHLEEALGKEPPREVAYHLRELIWALRIPTFLPRGDLLRAVRVVHLLETQGPDEAKELLRTLAEELPWDRARTEAREALRRVERGP